jgi:hypothetical protein
MKRTIAVILAMGMFATAGVAYAGGKPDGATCHVHKSCASKLCLRQDPTDKFGACCTRQDCPGLGAQCGTVDNGCGTPIECGDCGPGNDCVNNQCVQGTTTTTVPVPPSCAGRCGDGSGAGGCYCDTLSCSFGDGCGDRDVECPEVCGPPPSTTTTLPVTTTTLGGCFNESCGSFTLCNVALGCYSNQTTDNACGECLQNIECPVTECTSTADCDPGSKCAINTCCGSQGVCIPTCDPNATTTTTTPPKTTSTTSTTLSPI